MNGPLGLAAALGWGHFLLDCAGWPGFNQMKVFHINQTKKHWPWSVWVPTFVLGRALSAQYEICEVSPALLILILAFDDRPLHRSDRLARSSRVSGICRTCISTYNIIY